MENLKKFAARLYSRHVFRISATVLLVILLSIVALRFSSPEDTWICVNNAWVKHGNPSAPAPTSGCGILTQNTLNTPGPFDPLNAAYRIEGETITLRNGSAETEEVMPYGVGSGATTKTETAIFGVPIRGDINGDGRADAAFFLVQDTGGTGRFYYAAAALDEKNGTTGTNAIFLGDRIAPQTIQIQNGLIIVNYADRAATESFAASPSFGVSKYLVFDGTMLKEVAAPGVK